jgi:hypothetical protein
VVGSRGQLLWRGVSSGLKACRTLPSCECAAIRQPGGAMAHSGRAAGAVVHAHASLSVQTPTTIHRPTSSGRTPQPASPPPPVDSDAAEFKAEVARRGKDYLLTMATGAGPSGWQGALQRRACRHEC